MPRDSEQPNPRGIRHASAFYLFFFAAHAAIVPYLTLYFQQLGLSGSQIGLLAGIPPILSLVSAPFWTGLADASGRHRLVLGLGLFGTAASTVLITQAGRLTWLVPAIISYAFFSALVIPMGDSSTLHMLGEQKSRYGKIRLWGSVGWGIASPLVGRLIDGYGLVASFTVASALYLVVMLVSLGMSHARSRLKASFWRGVRQVLADRRWYSFLALAAVGGMCMSVVNSYLLLFMDSLGASKTLMGWVMVVATLSEIPVLFYVNRWLKRWGARRLMAVSIAAYALRGWLVSLAQTPEMLLPIQLLHGATFALLIGAGVSLADEMSPQGLSATGQGLFSAALAGIGLTTGAVLGGWLYDQVGAPDTFLLTSLIALGVLLAWITLGKGLKAA
jgi:PPP family 3-phenylpropionic acid transporter